MVVVGSAIAVAAAVVAGQLVELAEEAAGLAAAVEPVAVVGLEAVVSPAWRETGRVVPGAEVAALQLVLASAFSRALALWVWRFRFGLVFLSAFLALVVPPGPLPRALMALGSWNFHSE